MVHKVSRFLGSVLRSHVVVAVMIIGVMMAWMWATHEKYDGYVFGTGDTAVAEQAIWNTIFTGRLFHQSFLIGNEFNLREHLNIVQFLYVPFYAVVPHTLTLFAVIQVFFAFAAWTIWRYVYARIGVVAAWIALLLWLLHPLVLKQVIGPMHVVAIGGPLFLWLLMAYRERWYGRFVVLCCALALVSEFVAPTLFLVGVLALWHRRSWRWILPPMVAGALLQLVAKVFITVGFGSAEYLRERFHDALALDVPKFTKRVKRVYEWLLPLGVVLPLLSRYALLLAPSLAIVLFIIIYGRISGGSHVFVLIPPILIMIFVELVDRFRSDTGRALDARWARRLRLPQWVQASVREWGIRSPFLLGVVSAWIVIIGIPHFIDRMDFKTSIHRTALDAAIIRIKDGGSVTADASIGPHVNRRAEFFLPDNRQFTDYVLLKRSKYAEKRKEKRPALETRKLSYRDSVEESGRYRVIFTKDRVTLWVAVEKIAQLLNISPDDVRAMDDAELRNRYEQLPTPRARNIFGMEIPL